MEDFKRVYVPDIVCKEVSIYRDSVFEKSSVGWDLISSQSPVKVSLQTIYRIFSLDAGEVAALTLMSEKPGMIFLTDDAAARLVATKLGYNVRGTIGVLIRAARRKLMDPEDVVAVLKHIPLNSTLHIKASLLKEVISRVKQEYGL